MKVICPHCNVPKEINDVVAGIRVKCAACQSEFVAGGSPPPQDSPSPVSDNDNIERIPCVFCQHMVVKDALKCPNCKGTIGSVPCPSCRESVPANTISCPHCQTQIRKPAQRVQDRR